MCEDLDVMKISVDKQNAKFYAAGSGTLKRALKNFCLKSIHKSIA